MRRASWFGLFLFGLFLSAVVGFASTQQTMGTQQNSLSANQSLIAASMEPVAGEPYRADKITRSTWTLSDGTSIAHETKGMIARDADGRMREDIYLTHSGNMNGRQLDLSLESATVSDPVAHTMLMWTGQTSKIAMQMQLPTLPKPGGLGAVLVAPPPPLPPGAMPNVHAIKDDAPPPGSLRMAGAMPTMPPGVPSSVWAPKDEVRTEALGQQSMEGVLVTGKRVTTTIPIGKVGNDRPIVVVHEEWRSPELKIVLKTIDTDPRTGEQTMELQNLVRGDPDAALFQPPAGYEVKDMADMLKGVGQLGKTKTP
jgi:hypothetical protein